MPGIRVDAGVDGGRRDLGALRSDDREVDRSGETREAARRRAIAALRSFPILGIRTNVPFLIRLLEHPRFVSGDIDTGFLDRGAPRCGRRSMPATPRSSGGAAEPALALGGHSSEDSRTRGTRCEAGVSDVCARRRPFPPRPASSGSARRRAASRGQGRGRRRRDGYFSTAGSTWSTPEGQTGGPTHDDMALSAPMPATVARVMCAGPAGRAWGRPDQLEAMKMELPITAPRDGRVRAVAASRASLSAGRPVSGVGVSSIVHCSVLSLLVRVQVRVRLKPDTTEETYQQQTVCVVSAFRLNRTLTLEPNREPNVNTNRERDPRSVNDTSPSGPHRRSRSSRRPSERGGVRTDGGEDRVRQQAGGCRPHDDRGLCLRQPEMGAADGRCRRGVRRHHAAAGRPLHRACAEPARSRPRPRGTRRRGRGLSRRLGDFSTRNINQTIDESLPTLRTVCAEARDGGLRVRAYLSTSFGCPFEGAVAPARVAELTRGCSISARTRWR